MNIDFDISICDKWGGALPVFEDRANKYGYTLNGFGPIFDETEYCLNILSLSDVITCDEYEKFAERLNANVNRYVRELPHPRREESQDVYYVVFKCWKCHKEERMRIPGWLSADQIMKYLRMWRWSGAGCHNPECDNGDMFFWDVEQSKEEIKRHELQHEART